MSQSKAVVILLILVSLHLLACSKKKQEQDQQQTAKQETPSGEISSDTLPAPESASRFQPLPEIEIEAGLSPPTKIDYITWDDSWTPKLAELPAAIYWNFFDSSLATVFTSAQKNALANRGFFVEQEAPRWRVEVDDMIDLYSDLSANELGIEYSIVPVYISTDLLLHVYHLLFDHALQEMEQAQFRPMLAELTAKLYDRSKQDYEAATDGLIKMAALKNQAYFAVAGELLKNKEQSPLADEVLSADAKKFVNAELALINGAKGIAGSPLFDVREDYSQFRPRGHYTRSDELSSYFRAMMWYGRMPFSVEKEQATLQALLITRALRDRELEEYWLALMNPIDFLIGEQEDLGVGQYRQLMREVYGESPALEDFANREKLTRFRDQAGHLPKRRVAQMTEQAFRFMGQRFVPDAEIFSKLTTPRVGARLMPKAADVMAILGSAFAETLLEDDKATISGYADSLQALKSSYQEIATSQWQRNTYWCWLNTLRPLLGGKDQRFPFFMRGLSWRKKSLLTSLSSWAELKHDTILYTVQSYAELGEGGEEEEPKLPPSPPQPKGYVEPDLEFFNRLIYMVEKTFRTLEAAKLLSDEYRQKMAEYLANANALRAIVRKELLNESLSYGEYDFITQLADDLKLVAAPAIGSGSEIQDERSNRMAVVADVHTDAWNGQVLEVGVGTPQRIYVAVKDESGGARVAVGYIFSYYEFSQPMDNRMTDEEWQNLVYGGHNISDKEPRWVNDLRK
jgi:hypothetical protein